MKKIILAMSLLFSVAGQADFTKEFKMYHGTINLESLGNLMGKMLDADVSKVRVRRINKAYQRAIINTISNHRRFFVTFNINNAHNVACDFTLYKNDNQILIHNCESKTADVIFSDFIQVTDIGLDLITQPGPEKVKFGYDSLSPM